MSASLRTRDTALLRLFDRVVVAAGFVLVLPVLTVPQVLAEWLDRIGYRVYWQPACVGSVGYCERCRAVLDTPDGAWGGSDFDFIGGPGADGR